MNKYYIISFSLLHLAATSSIAMENDSDKMDFVFTNDEKIEELQAEYAKVKESQDALLDENKKLKEARAQLIQENESLYATMQSTLQQLSIAQQKLNTSNYTQISKNKITGIINLVTQRSNTIIQGLQEKKRFSDIKKVKDYLSDLHDLANILAPIDTTDENTLIHQLNESGFIS